MRIKSTDVKSKVWHAVYNKDGLIQHVKPGYAGDTYAMLANKPKIEGTQCLDWLLYGGVDMRFNTPVTWNEANKRAQQLRDDGLRLRPEPSAD